MGGNREFEFLAEWVGGWSGDSQSVSCRVIESTDEGHLGILADGEELVVGVGDPHPLAIWYHVNKSINLSDRRNIFVNFRLRSFVHNLSRTMMAGDVRSPTYQDPVRWAEVWRIVWRYHDTT